MSSLLLTRTYIYLLYRLLLASLDIYTTDKVETFLAYIALFQNNGCLDLNVEPDQPTENFQNCSVNNKNTIFI